MQLQFRHQKFQADAAKAVVDVFAGQPYLTPTYMMDRGIAQIGRSDEKDFTGWSNQKLIPQLDDRIILEHIQKIQDIILLLRWKQVSVRHIPISRLCMSSTSTMDGVSLS